MTSLDPELSELGERLGRMGYIVVPHRDHLCLRLPLLTSVVVHHADGQVQLSPQFGPFTRSRALLLRSGAACVAVVASALLDLHLGLTIGASFLGVVALAHDACRFIVTEGALTRLQLLLVGNGALSEGATPALRISERHAEPMAVLPERSPAQME